MKTEIKTTAVKHPAVLAVDDDDQSLNYLLRTMDGLDAELVACKSSQEALEHLSHTEFALAILDIGLPVIDGFTLATLIREQTINEDVPFLFLTGDLNNQARIAQGYQLGAVDFLEKFVQPDVLRAKIAVFVEIFRRRKLVLAQEREQQRLAQEHKEQAGYVQRLEAAIASYREMSTDGSVTRAVAGDHPLKERDPATFKELVQQYEGLLERYMQQLVVSVPKPLREMSQLVQIIGNQGGGPRDLLDIHLYALEVMVKRSNARRAEAYSVEGRLIALEMMGLLADYYRVGASSLPRREI